MPEWVALHIHLQQVQYLQLQILKLAFTIDEVIEDAYERCGVQGITGYQLKAARRSLNILFQEWENRGLHYWEVGNTNIDLVEGQAEYVFYRDTSDGASATTVAPASVYGLSDIMEASFRQNYGGNKSI